MPVTDNVTVNGSGGAFVNVSASTVTRKVTIMEDPVNGAAQGMDYQLPDDNFVATHNLASGEVLTLGNTVGHGGNQGSILGMPDQSSNKGSSNVAATIYIKLRSHTVTATKARVVEIC